MQVGSFTVLKQIGEGNYGITYKGEHTILRSPVCIKQEKTNQPQYQKLFKEEAMMLWKLRHPSLPHIKDYIVSPDPNIGHVMILSFIEGENLEKVVETKGPIDSEHVCWIIDRIFNAVSYLHYNGIIHSDLKPDNIILDIPEHNATVVDLGMASFNPTEVSSAKGGTPFYLPPEYDLGKPPIPASDIYSIGMIAVRIIGGNIGTGNLPADIHPKLKAFFEKMIKRNPMDRPQSIDPLRAELLQIRKEVFGRTSCAEVFKFKNGVKL